MAPSISFKSAQCIRGSDWRQAVIGKTPVKELEVGVAG